MFKRIEYFQLDANYAWDAPRFIIGNYSTMALAEQAQANFIGRKGPGDDLKIRKATLLLDEIRWLDGSKE